MYEGSILVKKCRQNAGKELRSITRPCAELLLYALKLFWMPSSEAICAKRTSSNRSGALLAGSKSSKDARGPHACGSQMQLNQSVMPLKRSSGLPPPADIAGLNKAFSERRCAAAYSASVSGSLSAPHMEVRAVPQLCPRIPLGAPPPLIAAPPHADTPTCTVEKQTIRS